MRAHCQTPNIQNWTKICHSFTVRNGLGDQYSSTWLKKLGRDRPLEMKHHLRNRVIPVPLDNFDEWILQQDSEIYKQHHNIFTIVLYYTDLWVHPQTGEAFGLFLNLRKHTRFYIKSGRHVVFLRQISKCFRHKPDIYSYSSAAGNTCRLLVIYTIRIYIYILCMSTCSN